MGASHEPFKKDRFGRQCHCSRTGLLGAILHYNAGDKKIRNMMKHDETTL